jgi:hypothetical protein
MNAPGRAKEDLQDDGGFDRTGMKDRHLSDTPLRVSQRGMVGVISFSVTVWIIASLFPQNRMDPIKTRTLTLHIRSN